MKKSKFIAGLCLIGQFVVCFILFLIYWGKSKSFSRTLAVFSAVGGVAGALLVVGELRNRKISREMEEDIGDYDIELIEELEDVFDGDIDCDFIEE